MIFAPSSLPLCDCAPHMHTRKHKGSALPFCHSLLDRGSQTEQHSELGLHLTHPPSPCMQLCTNCYTGTGDSNSHPHAYLILAFLTKSSKLLYPN